jgi:hypothetical protein
MCFQGAATATIKNDATPLQQGRNLVQVQKERAGTPADAPDFSDNLLQEARKRQAAQLLLKSNRRDALANNPGAPAPVDYSLLK